MGEFSITPGELYPLTGAANSPRLFDVCKCEDYDAADRMLPGAVWRDPAHPAEWAGDVPRDRMVVVSCVEGLKVSQAIAALLRADGIDARILEGGFVGWQAAGLPTVRKHLGIGARGAAPSRWVTRVAPKIDRIACPWLVARFIDPLARFLFVRPDQVAAAAVELGAIAYDIEGIELSHRGDGCTFDSLLEDFRLADPALSALAIIVRGADTARLDLAPQAAGLLAVSLGISALAGPDDHRALAHGFLVYDALYAWLRHARDETHNWPAVRV